VDSRTIPFRQSRPVIASWPIKVQRFYSGVGFRDLYNAPANSFPISSFEPTRPFFDLLKGGNRLQRFGGKQVSTQGGGQGC
jgi:hypothetical protein